MANDKLSIKEQMFCNEYIKNESNALSKNQIIDEQYQLFILAKANEEYKTASSILESLTKMLGYAPTIDSTKHINHTVKFERLLKDITPTISDGYEAKLIN